MNITVQKADLVREIAFASSAVERKTTIPILSNLLLVAENDMLTITATDLERAITCRCAADVKQAGSITIPARRLHDWAKLLPDAPINLKTGDNAWVNLTCGKSRSKIAGMNAVSFPTLSEMPVDMIALPAALLAQSITRTQFAISTESSKFTLEGCLLYIRDGKLTMVTTDGHRASVAEQSCDVLGDSSVRILIPKGAMLQAAKLAEGQETLYFAHDENHMFFRVGDRVLLSRRLSGNFPDYQRVLPREQPIKAIMERAPLTAALDRVLRFADERSHAVKMRFAHGLLTVYAAQGDVGECEETLDARCEGITGEMKIGLNAGYVLDFLKVIDTDHATMLMRDATTAAEFRPGTGDTESYRYIVMPMRA